MAHAIDGTLGVDLSSASTTQEFALGKRVVASDGAVYEYGLANGAISQYSVCKVDDDFQLTELTTAISASEPTRVGVPQLALADNEYGWHIVAGPFSATLAGSISDGDALTTTTTAGTAGAGGDAIGGARAAAASGGGGTTACFAATEMRTN